MIEKIGRLVPVVIFCTLLVTNVVLIIQNRKLESALGNSRQAIIEVGYRFTEMEVGRLDGSTEIVDFASGQNRTVIFVFHPSCQYCVQQYRFWLEATNSAPSDLQFIAISSESNIEHLREHVANHGLDGIRIAVASAAELRKSRMSFTPLTVLVDRDGKVENVWPGLWTTGFDFH